MALLNTYFRLAIYLLLKINLLFIIINNNHSKFNIVRHEGVNMGEELMAYDVKARKKVKIEDPKLVTLKNGRKAIKGTSPETGIVLFRIISPEQAKEFK